MSENKTGLIIFDLDGTLVDAFRAVTDSFNYALRCLGQSERPDAEIERCVGQGERRLVEQLIAPDKVEEALVLYRDHHKEILKTQVRLLPHVWDVLTRARDEGILLAVATNRPSYFTHIILDQLHIRSFFARVVCADEVLSPKPDPLMLRVIIDGLSLDQKNVVFIGDTTTDMETGAAAGVRTFGIVTGPHTRDELDGYRPFRVMADLSELFPVLRSINR